ncbi:hypothetical protein FRC03_006415 [Tulasnella sp. 419]|nr:hypothetical protein FRC03_006415 [Tulasnella sp. 419]
MSSSHPTPSISNNAPLQPSAVPVQRFFMHFHNYAQRAHVQYIISYIHAGPQDRPTWTCTIRVGNQIFVGTGLKKKRAKDAAAFQALVSHNVDFNQLTD